METETENNARAFIIDYNNIKTTAQKKTCKITLSKIGTLIYDVKNY